MCNCISVSGVPYLLNHGAVARTHFSFGLFYLYPTVTECSGLFYINNSFETKLDLESLDFDTIKANALAMFFKSLNG
jgi:hypothetical protein